MGRWREVGIWCRDRFRDSIDRNIEVVKRRPERGRMEPKSGYEYTVRFFSTDLLFILKQWVNKSHWKETRTLIYRNDGGVSERNRPETYREPEVNRTNGGRWGVGVGERGLQRDRKKVKSLKVTGLDDVPKQRRRGTRVRNGSITDKWRLDKGDSIIPGLFLIERVIKGDHRGTQTETATNSRG